MRGEGSGAEKVSVVLTRMDDRLRGRQATAMAVWIEIWMRVTLDAVSRLVVGVEAIWSVFSVLWT